MFKIILKKLFIIVSFILLCLPIYDVKAWEADNITLSNINLSNNNMVSFDLPSDLGEATSWIFLQTEDFDNSDLTDFGNINYTYGFESLADIINNPQTGDNIMIYILLLGLSIIGLVVAAAGVLYFKKIKLGKNPSF